MHCGKVSISPELAVEFAVRKSDHHVCGSREGKGSLELGTVLLKVIVCMKVKSSCGGFPLFALKIPGTFFSEGPAISFVDGILSRRCRCNITRTVQPAFMGLLLFYLGC